VKEFAGSTGTFDAQIIPPLQRWANDNVMVRGHEGNPLFFLVGIKETPASNPLPNFIKGNLLLDLSTAVIIPLTMPTGRIIDFKTSLKPNSGVVVQMVDVDSATSIGVFSNLLK
jgi:hypothetical protein